MTVLPEYVAWGDGGWGWSVLSDQTHRLMIGAEQVRQERTGVHARLSIEMNGVSLAWGLLNVEKDEDRVRMANSAWKHLAGNGLETYSANYLKNDVDLFCRGLWNAAVSAQMPELMPGEAQPKPPRFTLAPYVLAGGGTLLFAPPGRGKSFTGLLWAVSIDAGIDRFWRVEQQKVCFVNLERSRIGVSNRLGAINRVLGLDPRRPVLTLNARGRSLLDVVPALTRAIKEHGVGHVLLDSLSRAGLGDLNENQSVNKIMDTLNGLPCDSWSALAHTPRGDETHVYGGIHFDAAADIEVRLMTQQDEGSRTLGVGLKVVKDNDTGGTQEPAQVLAYEFDETGIQRVRPARVGEFAEIEANRKPKMREVVKQFLLSVGKATATQVAEETGFNRQNVASMLSSGDTFLKVGREGREVFYGVKSPS